MLPIVLLLAAAPADPAAAAHAFERDCAAGSAKACSKAAALYTDGFPSAVPIEECGSAKVCYLVGRWWCAFPCQGTVVNLGNALVPHQLGSGFGEPKSCVEAIRIAGGMDAVSRITDPVCDAAGCFPLAGRSEWSAWSPAF